MSGLSGPKHSVSRHSGPGSGETTSGLFDPDGTRVQEAGLEDSELGASITLCGRGDSGASVAIARPLPGAGISQKALA